MKKCEDVIQLENGRQAPDIPRLVGGCLIYLGRNCGYNSRCIFPSKYLHSNLDLLLEEHVMSLVLPQQLRMSHKLRGWHHYGYCWMPGPELWC
jgi:hypothetical protein